MTAMLPSLDELLALDADPDAHIDAADHDDFDTQTDRLLAAYTHRLADLKRAERRCTAQLAELEARHARALEPHRAEVERLRSVLELRHRAALADNKRATRIVLTNGTLTSKAGAVEYVVDDPEALLAFCQEQLPEVVHTPTELPPPRVPKPDLRAATKAATLTKGADGSQEPVSDEGHVYTADGQIVPGVHVVKKDRTFTVETEGFTETPEIGF